jgi:hypothetical protein
VSDDLQAVKTDLAGYGKRLNVAEVEQGKQGVRLDKLESWTRDQEEKLDDLSRETHNLALGIQKMRDDIVVKISTRLGIIVGIATILIIVADRVLGQ